MNQQIEGTVEARRRKAELIVCPVCDVLVPDEFYCSNCGVVRNQERLIEALISLGARKPDPPAAHAT